MMDLTRRGAIAIVWLLAATLAACTSSGIENGLESVPPISISESERIALNNGAIGATGLQLTDADSGASVSIPGGTVITLDASLSDDTAPVTPESIVVVLRPVGQYIAAQNGDFLSTEGGTHTKVGALAILPTIARFSQDIEVTIPLTSGTSGDVTIWKFIPDDLTTADGELIAMPAVGHWRFLTVGTAVSNKVIFSTDSFGQFIVTKSSTSGGGQNEAPVAALTANPTSGPAPLTVQFNAGGSTDDGTIARYQWDWNGDGTYEEEGTSPTISHEFAEGVYDVAVQVTDDGGLTDTATVQISAGNEPPTVTGVSPTEATANVPVTLTVAATESDGTIANYAWDFNGGTDFEVDRGAENTVEHTFTTAGPANIRVRVTDDDGAHTIFPATITVNEGSGELTIVSVVPLTAVINQATEFRANVTGGGSGLTFDWDWENDGTFDINDATVPTATHTFETAGDHAIAVRVSDDAEGEDQATFTVIVSEPVAGAPEITDLQPRTAEAGEEETFTITAADTDGGSIAKYEWDWDNDGVYDFESTTVNTAVNTFTTEGNVTIGVKVTDNEDKTAERDFVIEVTPPIVGEPSVTLTADPQSGVLVGGELEVTFTAALFPPGIEPTSVEYRYVAGGGFFEETDGTPLTSEFVYDAPGEYEATVRVNRAGQAPLLDTVTVTVTAAPNELPTASFTWFADPENPLRIIFSGAASSDPDGTITAWSWDFDNDGTSDATGQSAARTFAAPGNYPVTLTVSDDATPAGEDSDTQTVTVAAG